MATGEGEGTAAEPVTEEVEPVEPPRKSTTAAARPARQPAPRPATAPAARAARPAKKVPARAAAAAPAAASAAVEVTAEVEPTGAAEPAPPGPATGEARLRRLATWPGRAVAVAWVLLATDVLLLIGVLLTGLVANGRQGNVWARLGTSFNGDVGTSHALVLVVAALLLSWAAGTAGAARSRGPAVRASQVVLAVAAVLFIATPFAAWGYLSYLHHAKQVVDGAVRAQIATWMAVTMVPEGVAGAVAWWVMSTPV